MDGTLDMAWMVAILFFVLIAQGVLWAVIGFQASKLFSWWPFLRSPEDQRKVERGRY